MRLRSFLWRFSRNRRDRGPSEFGPRRLAVQTMPLAYGSRSSSLVPTVRNRGEAWYQIPAGGRIRPGRKGHEISEWRQFMHSAISRTQQACPSADCVICNGTHRGSKLAQADMNMASRTALLLYVLAKTPTAYADDLTPPA